ncbi:MAG: MBL fold metallo-hydrolase [Patescibacteria group bacterium]
MKARIQFLGGVAGDLTGSCYYLTVSEGKKCIRILFDSGLIQCSFNDSLDKNQEILNHLNLAEIDYIVLTHSHIDHIGRLPLFVKNGFKGRIICTIGTKSLLGVMLEDSAKIQMAEASYLNAKAAKDKNPVNSRKGNTRNCLTRGNYDRVKRKGAEQKCKKCLPLYTTADAEEAQKLVKNGGYEYHQWTRLAHNLHLKFYPSGHVMGGAIAVVKIDNKPKAMYMCFSGDLGRRDGIILPPPEIVTEAIDYLVIESTYGGQTHPERDQEIEKLLNLIKLSHEKNKRIIIPSFALERSQEIIYLLSYYMAEGIIPKIPIYLDSPLGAKITEIFSAGWTQGMFSDQAKLKFNPFCPEENPYFNLVVTPKESEALIAKSGNYIVIAGSGMCDAGRVRGHLRSNLAKSDTMVFLVGYMAERSLGRRLKDGKTIKMNGQEIKVQAEILIFDSFSAHADGKFLVDYAKEVSTSNIFKRIFIVHGEGEGAKKLKIDLENIFSKSTTKINIPKIYEDFTIN